MVPRRVVVTGLSVISSLGQTIPSFWQSLNTDSVGFGLYPHHFPLSVSFPLGSVVKDLNLSELNLRGIEVPRTRSGQMSVASGLQAMRDSGFFEAFPENIGVCVGSMFSGSDLQVGTASHLGLLGEEVSKQVLRMLGVSGSSELITQSSAAGLSAMCRGADWILLGRHEVVLVGGVESPFDHHDMLELLMRQGWLAGVPSSEGVAWDGPFTETPSGLLAGEGAAFLVLESYEHAMARGAHIYGEWLGWAGTMSGTAESWAAGAGKAQAEAMKRACQMSRQTTNTLDLCFLTGMGVRESDAAEISALDELWPHTEHIPYITTLGARLGHLFAASGPLHVITALLTMTKQVMPKLPQVKRRGRLTRSRQPSDSKMAQWSRAVVLGTGFGGNHVAVIVSSICS